MLVSTLASLVPLDPQMFELEPMAGWINFVVMGAMAVGSYLKNRAKKKAAEQQMGLGATAEQNEHESKWGGRMGEVGAFKNRLLGNLDGSQRTDMYGLPGSPQVGIRRLDFGKLFGNINAGQFGQDLRSSTPEQVNAKVDYSLPEKLHTGGSAWGDIISAGASAYGAYGGGGGSAAGQAGGLSQLAGRYSGKPVGS